MGHSKMECKTTMYTKAGQHVQEMNGFTKHNDDNNNADRRNARDLMWTHNIKCKHQRSTMKQKVEPSTHVHWGWSHGRSTTHRHTALDDAVLHHLRKIANSTHTHTHRGTATCRSDVCQCYANHIEWYLSHLLGSKYLLLRGSLNEVAASWSVHKSDRQCA